MARTPQSIPDAELSILKVLWEVPTATVPELTQRIYGQETLATKATVQKLLGRLEVKHCVKRNRKTWPHQFSASVERDVLIARQLQSTAAKLCHGEMHPLLTSLVKTNELTAEDRKSLRGLLDELDRENQ